MDNAFLIITNVTTQQVDKQPHVPIKIRIFIQAKICKIATGKCGTRWDAVPLDICILLPFNHRETVLGVY